MATLYVMYGSATGNAEQIAKDLASQPAPAPFTSVHCDALEKFKKYSDEWAKPPPGGLRKHALIIVCSTTGNGDVPENASRFARYIKRKTTVEEQALKNVAYVTLGLGDTNYDVFCGAAKLLDKKLEEAGAERIKPLTMADEATGLEEVVEPWIGSIFKEVTNSVVSSGDSAPVVVEETTTKVVPELAPTAEPAAVAKTVKVRKTLDTTIKSESPLFILYGSATGNAEQIAKDLAETYNMFLSNPDATTYFPSVVCCDLNGWRKQCLPIWEKEPAHGGKHGVIVVTSTTGNADPPENAERFYRWTKRKQTVASMPLQHCAFSVLGLGDTNYDVFCAMGKAVDRQLDVLGGTRIKPCACADEATGLEEVVDPWVASILLEMSIACQPALEETKENIVQVMPVTPGEEVEEEKKMDVGDMPATEEPITSVCSGVRTLCNMLKLDSSCPLNEVDQKCLPRVGAKLSTCTLLSQKEKEAKESMATSDDDDVSVASDDSNVVHYTLQKPFESSICNARYLTATDTEAAKKAASILKQDDNKLQDALDVFTEQYPLISSETVSKDTVDRNGKRVIELTLALPDDSTFNYKPGDSIGMRVENLPADVECVLNMLKEAHGILPEQHLCIDDGAPMTVRDALRSEKDISSPLKNKRILVCLAKHATNCEERKALQMLASKTPEGESAFELFVDQQRLSVVDLLKEFPSCQGISLDSLLGMLPGIPPRYYSVSSSPLVCKENKTLTVSLSVVDYVTPAMKVNEVEFGLRRKKGVATSFLEAVASPFLSGEKEGLPAPIRIFPKPTSEFMMPSNLETPMILVGPGTGIAPFMGFLQHRQAILSQKEGEAGSIDVFFGCRHEDHDWLYQEDMKRLEEQGVISSLYTAFSRDATGLATNGSRRKYVQDFMLNDADCKARLQTLILEESANVYICGDGNKMAKDVQRAVEEIVGQKLEGEEAGKKYVEQMKAEKRYQIDIWSS